MKDKRHILMAVALCIVVAAGCGSASRDSATQVRMWGSFNEGMAFAAKEHKPVIIDFYTSWCHWCKVMDRETFANPDVKSYLAENFVTIRIDAESTKDTLDYQGEKYTPVKLARAFGVRGYPALAYVDRGGKLITVVPGFVPAKTFLPLLRYMKKECYRQGITLEEFMTGKRDCDSTETK
jgi:thioredoxin-related protein